MLPGGLTDPLREVEGKINWAHAHLEDLESDIDGLLDLYSEAVVREFDTHTGECVFRFDVVPRPTDRPSHMFGDVVHNLRSALDYLANQTVRFHGVTSQTPTKNTAFEVLTVAPTPHNSGQPALPNLSPGVDQQARVAYDAVQPYQRTGSTQPQPLTMLDDLNNIDKHRQLLVTVVSMGGMGWWGEDIDCSLLNLGPYNDGDEIARFIAASPDAYPNFHPNFSFKVRLNEPAAGRFGLMNGIDRVGKLLEEAVRYVVREFRPLFP